MQIFSYATLVLTLTYLRGLSPLLMVLVLGDTGTTLRELVHCLRLFLTEDTPGIGFSWYQLNGTAESDLRHWSMGICDNDML